MSSIVRIYFYAPDTGLFTGVSFQGPRRLVMANTPPGLEAFDATEVAHFDWRSQRIENGTLVDYQPRMPDDDEGALTWSWDQTTRRWVSAHTDAYHWRCVRAERDRRLSVTDWMVVKAMESGQSLPQPWIDYRQALRDITLQTDPEQIQWPQSPSP